jgi:hypothetical protein
MAKDRVGGRDTIVAGERHVHASAHAVAANGGEDRSREAVDGSGKGLALAGELEGGWAGELRDLVEISAG